MKKKKQHRNKKKISLVAIVSIAIALPLMVIAAMQIVNLRQDAQTTQATGQIAWPMFDGDEQKSGTNNNEPLLNKSNVSTLKQIWQVQLPTASDGSPVYLSAVNTSQGIKNLVYITTKEGSLLAFDESNGTQIWREDTSGGAGITTSSPAIDPNHQFVYSYGKDGKVHKYNVGTGAEDTSNGWPLQATSIPGTEKGSSALTIGNGYLYVTISAYVGDADPYVGHIVGKNLSTGAVSVFNVLCSNNKQLMNGSCGSNKAGVWARPAAVVDPTTGNVFISSGNGPYNPPNDLGDSIIELSADLSKVIDTYTPNNYSTLEQSDEDLGSSAPAIIPNTSIAVQGGKDSTLRILNTKNLSGKGAPYNTGGEIQSLSVSCDIFAHPLSWVDSSNTTWVFVTDMCNNLYAYKVNGNQLQQVYKNSNGGSSPLMINGMLFVQSDGSIKALDPTTGNSLWSGQVGSQHWQSPAVINGHIFVLDNDGNLTAFAVANTTPSTHPGNTTPTPPFATPSYVCAGSPNSICPSSNPTEAPIISNTISLTPSGSTISLSPSFVPNISTQPGNTTLKGNRNILKSILSLFLALISFLLTLIRKLI
jgi:outer membrane protein assembly factor BamB